MTLKRRARYVCSCHFNSDLNKDFSSLILISLHLITSIPHYLIFHHCSCFRIIFTVLNISEKDMFDFLSPGFFEVV